MVERLHQGSKVWPDGMVSRLCYRSAHAAKNRCGTIAALFKRQLPVHGVAWRNTTECLLLILGFILPYADGRITGCWCLRTCRTWLYCALAGGCGLFSGHPM